MWGRRGFFSFKGDWLELYLFTPTSLLFGEIFVSTFVFWIPDTWLSILYKLLSSTPGRAFGDLYYSASLDYKSGFCIFLDLLVATVVESTPASVYAFASAPSIDKFYFLFSWDS